ncbi:pyridoxal phosphate-dependent transferase [Pisolithus croceorrhizus]|nr:pyridoxal phosphate-dependent transferase [Pisolithus croceorrhizus]
MGNKLSSSVSSSEHRPLRVKQVTDKPVLVSHVTLNHRDEPRLSRSRSSHETLCEKHVYHLPCQPPPPPPPPPSSARLPLAYTPLSLTCSQIGDDRLARAYLAFLKSFPEYQGTWVLDSLRRTDFARLDRSGETYVDYMGGAQHPESLVHAHSQFLSESVLGNTHSVSNSSTLSSICAHDARDAVLSFFRAPPGYTVIFTANATSALKLVGESYPFKQGSSYVLCADSHNSVHGIREFASRRGAEVHYIPSTPTGGFILSTAKNILQQRYSRDSAPSLFALTGQSNISNTKNPLEILAHASALGYHTVLDAAALAPTSTISLTDTPVDAMAKPSWKCLNDRGSRVENVDVVQVPGTIVTRSASLHERFEDGTINYLSLSAVTDGVRFLSVYLPFLPLRLSCLMHFLTSSLIQMRHDTTGTPVVKILSKLPSKRLKYIGEQSDSGSTVSLIFLSPSGDMIPNSFVEHVAVSHNISLRTGCMCNPGGAAALLGIEDQMALLYPGVTLKDFERVVGRELGVVRISLGLATTFHDVWRVIDFASKFANHQIRQKLWDVWNDVPVGQAV